MTYEQILSDIKNKIYHPVYFLMGEEPYFIDSISDAIESTVLDEADKAFNQIILYGKDVNVHDIVTQARNFPMMGNYLVIIVKEAQDVKNIESMEPFLEMIPEGVKTEASDKKVSSMFVEEHIRIGIDALHQIIDNKLTVKHLRF